MEGGESGDHGSAKADEYEKRAGGIEVQQVWRIEASWKFSGNCSIKREIEKAELVQGV